MHVCPSILQADEIIFTMALIWVHVNMIKIIILPRNESLCSLHHNIMCNVVMVTAKHILEGTNIHGLCQDLHIYYVRCIYNYIEQRAYLSFLLILQIGQLHRRHIFMGLCCKVQLLCQYLASSRPHDHFHCLSFPYLHHSCKHCGLLIIVMHYYGMGIIKRGWGNSWFLCNIQPVLVIAPSHC